MRDGDARRSALEFSWDAGSSWLWQVAHAICFAFFRVFHRVQLIGCENIPETVPVLLVANHISYYDPILVALGSRRRVRFMTWEAVFRVPFLGWLVRGLGAFPVNTEKPGKSTMSGALAVLQRGEALGIFPEGGRSFDGRVGRFKPGAAWLAVRARATIVPVTLLGGFEVWSRHHTFPRPGKLVVKYHPPIVLDEATCAPHEDDKAFQAELMARVMDVVRSGLP